MDRALYGRALLVLSLWSAGGAAGWLAWQSDRWKPSGRLDLLSAGADPRRLVQEAARGDAANRPALLRRVAEGKDGESLASLVLREAVDDDPTTADPVLNAYREMFPNSPQLAVWEFSLRLKQGDAGEAVRVYRNGEAARRHNPSARRALMLAFAERAIEAGLAVEALAEIDPEELGGAFEGFASRLAARCEQGDADARLLLRNWIAAYNVQVGPSPSTDYYAGLAAEADGDDETAASHYADAMSRLAHTSNWWRCQTEAEDEAEAEIGAAPGAPPRQERDRIQRRWAALLMRLGRWDPAFDLHPLTSSSFDWLALTFESAGRADDLQRLVDRQHKLSPEDPLLPYWRGMIRWSLGEYADAAALLNQHLHSPAASRRAVQTADRKFRALIRLGRIEEARAMLSPGVPRTEPDGRAWAMIVAAHENDEAALERLLDEYTADRRDGLNRAYADPDLGPLLASPRFSNVRRQFPPPPS